MFKNFCAVGALCMSIGLFYGAMYGAITIRYIGKISFNTSFLFLILLYLRKCLFGLGVEMYKNIYNIETSIIVWLLLILSGDIETNPGPDNIYEHSVSILHSNIRSICNKIDYIIDNFSDFECLFTIFALSTGSQLKKKSILEIQVTTNPPEGGSGYLFFQY